MRVKIIQAYRHDGLEKKMNAFLQEHESKIEIIEIKWKAFLEHYVMILYKENPASPVRPETRTSD